MKYLRSMKGRWAVYFALFSLCFQISMPLGMAVAADRSSGDGFSKSFIICTAYGPKLLDDLGKEQSPNERRAKGDCPLCIAHHIGSTALPQTAAIIIAAPLLTRERLVGAEDVILVGRPAFLSYTTRAPPLSL